jgi:hypothetical protein
LNAVIRRANVEAIAMNGSRPVVVTDRGVVGAKRVVVATGFHKARQFRFGVPDTRMLTFPQFMRRFDEPSPLKGLGRVAVIGDGDSARTVVEALTGYGPYMGASVAALDYVNRIDWYGVGPEMDKETWLRCNRTRYKPLAALFPSANSRNERVRGLPRTLTLTSRPDAIQVEAEAYDTVVTCLGFLKDWRKAFNADSIGDLGNIRTGADVGEPKKGLVLGLGNEDKSVVVVGPAADIDFGNSDPEPRIEQNKVALFRLGPRTATLASLLPAV